MNGVGVRGPLEQFGKGYFLPLGPAWRRDSGLHLGEPVTVVLEPAGPQSEALAPDIVAALAAHPDAKQFFDGLATFLSQGLPGLDRRDEAQPRVARAADCRDDRVNEGR